MASNMDLFNLVGAPGSATTLAAPGHSVGGGTFILNSAVGLPTTTGIVFAVRQVTTSGTATVTVPGTYTVWEGVLSGTTISNAVLKSGTDQVYPSGSNTQVYITVSSAIWNNLITGILNFADQTGNLKSTAVVSSISLAGSNVIDAAALKDGSVTTRKLKPTSFVLSGAQDPVSTSRNTLATTTISLDVPSYLYLDLKGQAKVTGSNRNISLAGSINGTDYVSSTVSQITASDFYGPLADSNFVTLNAGTYTIKLDVVSNSASAASLFNSKLIGIAISQ